MNLLTVLAMSLTTQFAIVHMLVVTDLSLLQLASPRDCQFSSLYSTHRYDSRDTDTANRSSVSK